jgi:hypothetical protein
MSRCVWALIDEDLTDLLATLHITDPKHWVLFMCCDIPHVEGKQILTASWAIWNARRKAIHEGIFQSPFSIVAMVNRLIQEFDFVKGFEFKGCIKPHSKSRTQRWIAPERDMCKINVDAAVGRASSKGTVAAVCQSSQGHFVAASAMVVPNITNPEILEAMACLEALALAEDCGVYRLIVASDCIM